MTHKISTNSYEEMEKAINKIYSMNNNFEVTDIQCIQDGTYVGGFPKYVYIATVEGYTAKYTDYCFKDECKEIRTISVYKEEENKK